jgi:hypothetical protein
VKYPKPWHVGIEKIPVTFYDLVFGYAMLLPPIELRAHIKLLLYSWCSKTPGRLDLDDKHLAALCGVNRRTWLRIKAGALTNYTLVGNEWVNQMLVDKADRMARPERAESKRQSLPSGLRFSILRRDGFRCTYCGRGPDLVALQVDHIHPVSRGGTDEPENLRTACFDCNIGKFDQVIFAQSPEGPQ